MLLKTVIKKIDKTTINFSIESNWLLNHRGGFPYFTTGKLICL
jgi:hypothetical protein